MTRVSNLLAGKLLNVNWKSRRELVRHVTYYQRRNAASYQSRRKKTALLNTS